jgi:D-alanyl-D-alanine carboxypeptidase (penicillin-binding protein 5/6)
LLVLAVSIFSLFKGFKKPSLYADATVNNCSGVVIEAETGRVLAGYNQNIQLPEASTTKIVTALIVLEKLDPSTIILIPDKAVGAEGSSIYLKKGEKWKIIDLLYGMMLRSGNDAALALAIAVGGSVENFSDMMNMKAASLGLTNTNFVNPHGLHDDNHYTSAYDLAMLTREAFKHKLFCEIVSSKSYTYTNQDNIKCMFINKNKMLNFFEGANGVKTGFTKKSGRCLVSSAIREDMQLISVVLNCPDMWNESMRLLTNCFCNYDMKEIIKPGMTFGETDVKNSPIETAQLMSNEVKRYPLTEDEYNSLRYNTEFYTLKAPVKKGQKGGIVGIYLDNRLLFEANLYTIENVRDKNIKERVKDILDKWKINYEN